MLTPKVRSSITRPTWQYATALGPAVHMTALSAASQHRSAADVHAPVWPVLTHDIDFGPNRRPSYHTEIKEEGLTALADEETDAGETAGGGELVVECC